MIDTRSAKIRYHMNLKDLLIKDVAKILDVTPDTMTTKLRCPGTFTVNQMNELAEALELSDREVLECFFTV